MSDAIAIPHGTPETPATELVDALHDATQAVLSRIGPEIQAEGLTPCQFWTLYRLASGSLDHPGDIARRLGVTMPSVTASVDQLVEAGLVGRSRSDRDRRYVHLTITAAGRKSLGRVLKRFDASLSDELREVPVADLKVAARVLSRLSDRIRPPRAVVVGRTA